MRRALLTVWTIFWVFFWTTFYAFLACLTGLVDRRGYLTHYIARIWGGTLLFFSGVRISVKGLDQVPKDQAYVFVSNHESALDIPVLLYALPFQVRMMAKKELFRIPLFGWAIALGGYIKIDRSNTERAIASLREAAERVPRQGISVLVFPEGTRSPTGKLRRFKKGGFAFAQQTGLSIVPISILGSRHLTPKKAKYIKPGKIDVVVGTPIEVTSSDREHRDDLVRATRDFIQARKEERETATA